MSQFRKPSPKPRNEPPGLDAFAAGAAVTPIVHIVERRTSSPEVESETVGMNVRFTRAEKLALEAIARYEDRSQQKVLSRLVGPLLVARARELELQSGA
jgi:hypothetical protein